MCSYTSPIMIWNMVWAATDWIFLLYFCSHSFVRSFVHFIKYVRMEKNMFVVSVVESWQLVYKSKRTWKTFADAEQHTYVENVDKSLQNRHTCDRIHPNGWDSLCARESLHTLVAKAFVEVTFFWWFFYALVLCVFLLSLLVASLASSSILLLLLEMMPLWCAVIAAILKSLAVAIVCSGSLRCSHRNS